jgi:aspartate carbamoyltransferase catalytic subunit
MEDTVRVIQGYADAIVIRHYEEGTAARASAAAVASCSLSSKRRKTSSNCKRN